MAVWIWSLTKPSAHALGDVAVGLGERVEFVELADQGRQLVRRHLQLGWDRRPRRGEFLQLEVRAGECLVLAANRAVDRALDERGHHTLGVLTEDIARVAGRPTRCERQALRELGVGARLVERCGLRDVLVELFGGAGLGGIDRGRGRSVVGAAVVGAAVVATVEATAVVGAASSFDDEHAATKVAAATPSSSRCRCLTVSPGSWLRPP